MKKILKSSVIILILYSSYLLILLSIPYLTFNKNIDFLETKQLIYHIKIWRISFYTHVFSSSFILITGLFQFNQYFIYKQKKLHKIFGYIYLSLVLIISGPSALCMSFYANGGYFSKTSFILLTCLWITTTAISFKSILNKQVEKHGDWLLRSYALTLSAITLRFYAYLFDVLNIPLQPIETYTLLSWISWIPNLVIAEIMIRKGFIKKIIK